MGLVSVKRLGHLLAVTQEIAYLEPDQLARPPGDHAAVDGQTFYCTMYSTDHDGRMGGRGGGG